MMIEHKMLHLFGGNMSAHGLDFLMYDADGNPKVSARAAHSPVTPTIFRQHLEGEIGIGIYPMWLSGDKWMVKWGCCDIDTGNWSEAYSLAVTLKAMGFCPFVERSRSKGWHIWVFSDGPVEAWIMRRALKVAYKTCELQAREANPKSEKLRPGQLGNFVRLPFKFGLAGPIERQVMMANWDKDCDGEPVDVVEWFDAFDASMRIHPGTVKYWADVWKEPKRKQVSTTPIDDAKLRNMFRSMPEKLFAFIKDGPVNDTADRSEALVALAFKLKRHGYTPDEMYAAVKTADERWGKYHMRPDGDSYLMDIVERAL